MDPKDRVELLALLEMQANAPRYGELRKSRIKAVLNAGFSPAEAMRKARHGEALTEEEFVLANMGILPIEMKEIREARPRNEFPGLEDCPPLKSIVLNCRPLRPSIQVVFDALLAVSRIVTRPYRPYKSIAFRNPH